jgi:quercetin dioxygenase-like cupin family protein
MRIKIQVIVLVLSLLLILQCRAQTADPIFPKGELSTVKNHTGNIWLKDLVVGDDTFDPSVAVATYDSGAKLDWHIHPGGQVLLITEVTGYYQDWESPQQSFTRAM